MQLAQSAIGKLRRVGLREVWKDEASDFTPWLRDNIDVLGEALGLTLAGAEEEKSAGDFSVDLVAEDDAKNVVIVEGQLGKTDHDHLGKLLTYLVALDAKVAIWIAAEPRPEHISAVGRLNQSGLASFYLVKVEAVRIEESPPAPLFTLVLGPSEESRAAGVIKEELAERYRIRERFWTALLDLAKPRTRLHSGVSPNQFSWLGTGAGRSGLSFAYVVRRHDADVELYMDRPEAKQNKAVFDVLFKARDLIEKDFGEALEWERLEAKRASRIRKTVSTGGYLDEEKWPTIHDEMIETMVRFEKAFRPPIADLSL